MKVSTKQLSHPGFKPYVLEIRVENPTEHNALLTLFNAPSSSLHKAAMSLSAQASVEVPASPFFNFNEIFNSILGVHKEMFDGAE